MKLNERTYNPPRFEVDHLEGFRKRFHHGNIDDEAIEKAARITYLTIETFRSHTEAMYFKKFSFTWEGYCLQRKLLEETHAEGHGLAETIFIGGKRIAYEYVRRLMFENDNGK